MEGNVTCDACSKVLKNTVYIRCAECKDYDMCLECFAAGKHAGTHKPTHAYHVEVCLFCLCDISKATDG